VLVTSDALASAITVLILLFGVVRLQTNLPDGASKDGNHLGPKHTLTHVTVTVPAYILTSVGPLALLLLKPQTYFKHRMAIVTAIRIKRLLMLHLTLGVTYPSAFAPTIARIAVARALEAPNTGLVILLVQPVAYYIHHAMYLLPWQLAAPFQLATTVGVLHWNARFACFLQGAHPAVVNLPWFARAKQACESLQAYASLLSNILGLPMSDFSHTVCRGENVVSSLQMFWTIVCLFVIPLCITIELERWMRLRYHQQQAAAEGSSQLSSSSRPHSGYDPGSSSAGSWQLPATASSSTQLPTGRNINSFSIAELNSLTEGPCKAGSVSGHAFMLLLVLLLVLPLVWLLAELLAEGFVASRDCAAVTTH
jgi:hypothetical protein